MTGAEPGESGSGRDPEHLSRRLLTALVCATLEPGLPGVLLFDLPPDSLRPVADLFAGLLRAAAGPTGPLVSRLTLGAATRDEDLWVHSRPAAGPDGVRFTLAPGPLTEPSGGSSLVVVPDLARLSVPGMRAAVQLLGADTASVEHSGLRRSWQPRARWLAGCSTDDIDRVSPHLLDRFAVRLPAAGLRSFLVPPADGPLPDNWRACLEGSPPRAVLPFTDAAARQVEDILGTPPGMRRALALARTARGLARIGGDQDVSVHRVEEAARLTGLLTAPPPGNPPGALPAGIRPEPPSEPAPRRPPGRRDGGQDAGRDVNRPVLPGRPVLEPEYTEPVGAGPAAASGPDAATPYPEDRAVPLADFASLRAPWRRTGGPGAARGPVIGVRQARDLRDIAVVRTVMEAAKYQVVRGRPEVLAIAPSDLRGYLRTPEPERLLVLLLDHTCRGDWGWHEALGPFIDWAYLNRAAAHLVEVGSGAAVSDLRAESFAARSVLDPRIASALSRSPGRGTPLAHGLEHAAEALRRAFRHHRTGLAEACLVVVTDGRGNVPLEASRRLRLDAEPVARKGIDDALAVATRIGAMDRTRLHSLVVDPLRHSYGDLPFALAEALGAVVVEGRTAAEVRDFGR